MDELPPPPIRDIRPAGMMAPGGLLLAAGLLLWWQSALDRTIYAATRLAADGSWPARIHALTDLGGLAVMGPLALAVVIALWWRGLRDAALWLAVTIVTGRLLVEGVKLAVHRARPPVGDRLATVSSWSFPSSHSAGSMLTCVALALVLSGRWPALAGAMLIGAVIGWSRLALGVHWPSDVLAGWGIALVWAGLAWRVRLVR